MPPSFHRLAPLFFLLLNVLISQHDVSAGKLLVIYMDALHWQYVERRLEHADQYPKKASLVEPKQEPSNGFGSMRLHGAYVRKVRPVFPTQCLPNIHSSFSGRHPRNHGILGNQVYESKTGYLFDYPGKAMEVAGSENPVERMVEHFDQAPSDWWKPQTEMLWDTVLNQTGRPAALYFLPSIFELREVNRRRVERGGGKKGKEYHKVLPYKRDIPWETFHSHVIKAIGHLRKNVTNFAVVYNDKLDRDGHMYGPDSDSVSKVMKKLDDLLHKVVQETLLKPHDIHVMLMSDHGMQPIEQVQEVYLDWYIMRSEVEKVVNDGTVAGIWPEKDEMSEVYDRLKTAASYESEKFAVFLKNDIQVEKYFGRGPDDSRLPPIFVMAKKGYVLISREYQFPRNPDASRPQAGLHGYYPSHDDMHTSMMVFGPKIRESVKINSLDITQIYQLMATILDVTPRPHNGSFSAVASLLKKSQMKPAVPISKYMVIGTDGNSGQRIGLAVMVGMLSFVVSFDLLRW